MENLNDVRSDFLSIRNLKVEYKSGEDTIYAVNGVSFDLDAGSTIGLVGETGAGKTTIAKSILRILPDHSTKSCTGDISFEGKNILDISESEMRSLRGKKISMIFQDPMTSLNPVHTVVSQIAEGIQLHNHMSKAEATTEAIKMLETVGITSDRAYEYPHQFSGGMKQRVVIAIALACNPQLLIADEPTTALDVTIQAQVLDLIRDLQKKTGTAMILITHDLGVVAGTCDKVAVIYAGEVVEYGSKEDLFDHVSHPYTVGLFNALPDVSKDDSKRLDPIPGMPPDPSVVQKGCSFADRCPYAQDRCLAAKPDLIDISGKGHYVRCFEFEEN